MNGIQKKEFRIQIKFRIHHSSFIIDPQPHPSLERGAMTAMTDWTQNFAPASDRRRAGWGLLAPWRLTIILLAGVILASCGEPPTRQEKAESKQAVQTKPQGAQRAGRAINVSGQKEVHPAATGATPVPLTPTPAATVAQPTPVVDRSVLPKDAPKDAEIAADITPGVRGGKIVISMLSEPKTFNPLLTQSIDDQFAAGLQSSGLYGYDQYNQKDVPGLAKSWEYNEQTREWTFHLREGVRWSDGRPLTSDDFIFYTQLIFDPQIPNDEKYAFRLEPKPDSPLYEFRAPDPCTLVIKIPGVDSFSFQNLGQLRALPRHVLEKPWKEGKFMSAWGQNADPKDLVVSGPFKLKEMRPGEALIFERNPHFWRYDARGRQLPYIDQLVVLIVGDFEANELRFLAGDTDIFDSQSIKADNLARFQDEAETKKFTVYSLGPGLDVNHYYFNLNLGGTYTDEQGKQRVWQPGKRGEKPPATLKDFRPFVDSLKLSWFSNREFRSACSELTNRQQIIDNILFGEGAPLYGSEPPANRVWCNPNIPKFPYNPASAKARLDRIGLIDRNGDGIREDPQGHPIRFTIVTNRENNIREKTVQILKADFKAAGLDVQAQVLDFNNLVNTIKNTRAFDCCMLGLGTGVPPHPAMGGNVWLSAGQVHMWYPQQKAPMTEWEERLDNLYTSMKRTFNLAEQRKIYFKMQDIYCTEQPAIHLFVRKSHIAAKNKIGNLKPTAIRNSLTWNIDELYVKK